MLMTQTVEYAIRAMAHLVLRSTSEPIRAKDLAKESDVPPHYLSKILRKMVTSGLLESQKGHGGGFVLSRPPEEIRFIDILEAIDYQIEPDHCAFGWGECNYKAPCPLHDSWSELKDQFLEWAKKTTLKDVKKKGKEAKWSTRSSSSKKS